MLEWINLLSNCSTKRRIVRCFGCLNSFVRMRVSNFFSGYSSTGLGRPKKRCGTFPGHHSLRRTSKAFFSNLGSIGALALPLPMHSTSGAWKEYSADAFASPGAEVETRLYASHLL